MFENLENNIYDDFQFSDNKFVPNKKELEKLEERKKIEEAEEKLIDDLFNCDNNVDNNVDNNDIYIHNHNNSKIYDLLSKEEQHKNKQLVQRRKTNIEHTNYTVKRINRENEKDK